MEERQMRHMGCYCDRHTGPVLSASDGGDVWRGSLGGGLEKDTEVHSALSDLHVHSSRRLKTMGPMNSAGL